MIPSPNLDDRTYQDIVDEAIRLIPQYCPEWTNFNKSDPGITMIELFAWMAEMIIYRLNKVPEKNYLAFLDLMGIQRQPPQPARTVLTFDLSDKADTVLIEAGTQCATRPTGDRKALTFETESNLLVVDNTIQRVVSQYHDQYSDVTPWIEGRRPFEVFEGVHSVDRYLYFGDDRLENFGESAVLTVRFERTSPGDRSFPAMLEWEYFNGERWRELAPAGTEAPHDELAFAGPSDLERTEVHEVEAYWIRGRLAEVPEDYDETMVDRVLGRVEVLGEGVTPPLCYFNPTGEAFLAVDLDRNFKPLGDEPRIDNFFYVACDEVLSQPDTRVRLEMELTDQSIVEKPAASADLVLEWQYFNGKRWRPLARFGPGYDPPRGKSKDRENPYDFQDLSDAMTKNGTMSFRRPEDLRVTEVNGKEHHWLRLRVLQGGYGQKGSYELVDERWVYKDEHPLRPPSMKALRLKFSETDMPFGSVVAFNDFHFTDHSKVAATEYKPFQAFQPVPEENPTLYLGFESAFPNEPLSIYFDILDAASLGPGARKRRRVHVGPPRDGYDEQRVVWEFWNGKEWGLLLPRDETENFTASGFVHFVGPKGQRKTRRYGDNLYWFRARLEMGGYDEPPVCDRILLNSVFASHHVTYPETVLGSSQGTPNQSWHFNRGPVLPDQQIVVLETERPTDDEIAEIRAAEGPDAFVETEDGGYLVRWHEVESLYESSPRGRHYVKDITSGEVRFGDGVRGMIPPKGDRNVRAQRYRVGGGAHGNVPAGAIEVMKRSLSYVDGVTNHLPAMGGADLESVDEIKLRGPAMLKSRGRAVTREDFEALAIQASNSVARVNCIPGYGGEGRVGVVIVPRIPRQQADFGVKPMPTTELVRRVKQFLTERKLLTTRLEVLKPRYRELSVQVEIMRRSSGSPDRIKREIDERLHVFLHPLRGGKDKRGWTFGRNVFKVDLYHVVEEVEGVDFVSRIRIHDEDARAEVEQVRIHDDELPFLVNVEISEKAHEKIV